MTVFLNSLTALFPFLLLIPSERAGGFFDPLERAVTNRYRGFFALVVVLHHMAQRVSAKGLLWIYFDTGFLAVAMFFFYSGYGLMKKGIGQKEGFFRKRVPPILIPYLVKMLIYWFCYAMTGDVKSPASLLGEHLHHESGVSFLWFVFVYLAWILFLGLCLRFMRRDKQILYAAGVFALVFVLFGVLVTPGLFWIYDTVILILLGCAWAYEEERITGLIRKHYRRVLTVSLLLFFVSLPGHLHPVLRIPSYMISAAAFMVFLNTASMKRKPAGRVLSFLGGISFEIYLLHGIPVTFGQDFIADEGWLTLAVVIVAVISAYLMHLLAERTWKPQARKAA